MSIIHITQIADKVKRLFQSYLDLKDLSLNDAEIEKKILTRCLAAYSIYSQIDATAETSAESVMDGADDNGIDAIYYSPQNKRMIITQAKWIKDGKTEPDSAEVAKFCKGVKDLFEMNFDRFNDKVRQKQAMIEKALSEYETKYTLVVIDTSEKISLATHAQRHIDDLLEELNSAGEGDTEQLVEFIKLNQSKIFSSFTLSMGDSPINLEIGLGEWGTINEPHKAYYGMVSAREVAKWWADYQRKLFHKNIRQVLGATDVNNEIEETLESSPDKFWYYNNGITIIADKIEKSMVGGGTREIGAFKLENASVVNGAQTVSTIGKYAAKNEANLDKARVQTRIISLKDAPPDFGKEVTRTNNRQNRIENRDFASQEAEQIRIKAELAIEGIEYNIVRSELFQPSDKAFDLQEATVALACASGNSSLAVQAKKGIGKFYEDLTGSFYKSIFNPKVHGVYVYNCVRVDRKINDILKLKIASLNKKSGRQYGLLVHGNRIISLLTIRQLLSANEKLNDLSYAIDDSKLLGMVETIIDKVKKYLDKKYPDNILGTLFKNSTKCADIIQNV
jgi:AIPR protein